MNADGFLLDCEREGALPHCTGLVCHRGAAEVARIAPFGCARATRASVDGTERSGPTNSQHGSRGARRWAAEELSR